MKKGLRSESPFKGLNLGEVVKNLWNELDAGGTLLLSAAFASILLPLTLLGRRKQDGQTQV